MTTKTTRRQTIADDPLDLLTGHRTPRTKGATSPKSAEAIDTREPGAKARATFYLSTDLLNRARNTVVALSGPPHFLTLAQLVQDAITRELERLEKANNAGKPFPARSRGPKAGRPLR